MFGKLENKNAVSHLGILPRTISYIIEKLQAFYNNGSNHSNQNAMDWNLFISFGNVYNDKIYDLIDTQNSKNIHLKKKILRIRENYDRKRSKCKGNCKNRTEMSFF